MSKKTDGEKIRQQILDNWAVSDKLASWKIAPVIDRLVRQRMAKAWADGYAKGQNNDPNINPYQVKKVKA